MCYPELNQVNRILLRLTEVPLTHPAITVTMGEHSVARRLLACGGVEFPGSYGLIGVLAWLASREQLQPWRLWPALTGN